MLLSNTCNREMEKCARPLFIMKIVIVPTVLAIPKAGIVVFAVCSKKCFSYPGSTVRCSCHQKGA